MNKAIMRQNLRAFLAILLILPQFLTPIFAQIIPGEKHYFEKWSAEQTYTKDYAVALEKDPAKDFVVLNLADVQLEDTDAYGAMGELTTAIINELVEKLHPDLITLTGDNAWSTSAYIKLIQDLEATGIPWAPVMGNHDGQRLPSEFWAAYLMSKAKNCLFKFGPKDMGYGNYVINITQDGHIIHTLLMMDTHSSVLSDDSINGPMYSIYSDGSKGRNYDHFWSEQMEWYKWVIKGTEAIEGHTVESSAFFHIPVFEARAAYANLLGEPDSFGENLDDGVWSPVQSNGFFGMAVELGSTKNMIFGHDHTNCGSVVLDGIRLTYALKCGAGCYWLPQMSGGSTLSIHSDGSSTVEHHYSDLRLEDFE